MMLDRKIDATPPSSSIQTNYVYILVIPNEKTQCQLDEESQFLIKNKMNSEKFTTADFVTFSMKMLVSYRITNADLILRRMGRLEDINKYIECIIISEMRMIIGQRECRHVLVDSNLFVICDEVKNRINKYYLEYGIEILKFSHETLELEKAISDLLSVPFIERDKWSFEQNQQLNMIINRRLFNNVTGTSILTFLESINQVFQLNAIDAVKIFQEHLEKIKSKNLLDIHPIIMFMLDVFQKIDSWTQERAWSFKDSSSFSIGITELLTNIISQKLSVSSSTQDPCFKQQLSKEQLNQLQKGIEKIATASNWPNPTAIVEDCVTLFQSEINKHRPDLILNSIFQNRNSHFEFNKKERESPSISIPEAPPAPFPGKRKF